MNDFESMECEESVEVVGVRKLPWPVDILLFPVSVSGIINIFMIVLGPIVVSILPFGGILGFVFGLYACWYFPFATFIGHSLYTLGTIPFLSILAARGLLLQEND